MEAKRSRPRWTYAEFARLPSEGSTRYEVIDGELAVTLSPTGAHQVVVAHLMRILGPFAHENGYRSGEWAPDLEPRERWAHVGDGGRRYPAPGKL